MSTKHEHPLPTVFYPPEDSFDLALELEVAGQPPRKSNGRRIVTNQKTGKPMSIKSAKAAAYAEDFVKQVPGDLKQKLGSLDDPLLLWATVYYKNNQPDLSVELIKDLLQLSEIIEDDRYIKSELLFGKVDKNNPRTIIRLYRLK